MNRNDGQFATPVSAIPTLAGLKAKAGKGSGTLYPWVNVHRWGRSYNRDLWHAIDENGNAQAVLAVRGRRARRTARDSYARWVHHAWQANTLNMQWRHIRRGRPPWALLMTAVLGFACVVTLLARLFIVGGSAIEWDMFPRFRLGFAVITALFLTTLVLPFLPVLIGTIRARRRSKLTSLRLTSQGIEAESEDGPLTIAWAEVRDLSCTELHTGLVRLDLASGRHIWLGCLPPHLRLVFKIIQRQLVPNSVRHEYRAKLERRINLALVIVLGSMATGMAVDYLFYDAHAPETARCFAGWIFLVGAIAASGWVVSPGVIERLEQRNHQRGRRPQRQRVLSAARQLWPAQANAGH